MGLFASLRAYRQRQQTKAEAKHLVAEAKRILRKKRLRIPETVQDTVAAHVAVVEATRKAGSIDEFRAAVRALDDCLTEHLAYARKSQTRQYVESIGVALGVALLLRAFVVEAFQIPSGSMIPTLEVGDHIFVSKFAYSMGIPFTNTKLMNLGLPKRGDVIVFKYPPDQSIDYIKRVVGLPGETLEIRQNEIFINGHPMPRQQVPGSCYTDEVSDTEHPLERLERRPCEVWLERLDTKEHSLHQDPISEPAKFAPVRIPEGHYFVMGDNRDNSKDSRYWGFVPFELIKGRALVIWWSRDPSRGGLSLSGLRDWFASIQWRRFGKGVD